MVNHGFGPNSVEELKVEWKKLWQERLDDKVRAEGIAINDYSNLFVDKGTVIHATRNCKPVDFKDILNKHQINKTEQYLPKNPQIGGWNKFVKTQIRKTHQQENIRQQITQPKKSQNQPKKGGRGWLHK